MFCFFWVDDQRLGIRAFDADEDREEIRLAQHRQELAIVGEVHRGFGRELERIAVLPLPRVKLGQEALECLLVADQVVVDEVDMAAIAGGVKRVELGQHLLRWSWRAERGHRAR